MPDSLFFTCLPLQLGKGRLSEARQLYFPLIRMECEIKGELSSLEASTTLHRTNAWQLDLITDSGLWQSSFCRADGHSEGDFYSNVSATLGKLNTWDLM